MHPQPHGSMGPASVSDIHGAADALARAAAGVDALLVCGDLVNLIDYRTMEGIAAEVFGPEATRDFVRHRTAGRFEEAGGCCAAPRRGGRTRSATGSGRRSGPSTRRCSPPSPSPPT